MTRFLSKKVLLLSGGILLLLGAGYGAYALLNYRQAQKAEQTVASKTVLKDVMAGKAKLGDPETRDKLEAAVGSAEQKDKYQLYLLLANEYLSSKEYGKAADAYKKAEGLGGTTPDLAFNIAYSYELKGDKGNALAYYKKTRDMLQAGGEQKGSVGAAGFLARVNEKITGLGG